MKLVSFGEYGHERVGVVVEDDIIDLNAAEPELPSTMIELLAGDYLGAAEQGARGAAALGPDVRFKLGSVRLGAPVPRPSKVVCLGLNYRDHAEEQNTPLPERPLLFSKASSCVIGPSDDIVLPADSQQVDYEVEFAIVIGHTATKVSVEAAYEYIAGYTVMNDVSARNVQFEQKQWHQGKSYDTFGPMGPYLVTRDEIPHPHTLNVRLVLNGQTMQNSTTSNLIFNVPYLVSHISKIMTLYPGDVISTGTPAGVGVFRKPPVFLKPGDVVETIIDGIGTMGNRVRR
ncbi:MAG: fumarylacetoacetate hydrolase family protein [Candidatus Latescibacteria bacterium]|nr:fumarylacetoacetate hydrolase family protein [Candidatus Latescibacterota bacterium]